MPTKTEKKNGKCTEKNSDKRTSLHFEESYMKSIAFSTDFKVCSETLQKLLNVP